MELTETISKHRGQGKSVTDLRSSGAGPGPWPSSTEAVPGTSTHATESAPGSCMS
ncbi:hypothetical protein DPMN_108117 [Dreissena polymorpha]|uniref:Uncharacterized protein n=1 Tax=Dreissena polymorpha TaxID=45954 RepID=A0A9D4QLP7_DREPO|nr:hypothetical protein DPMN_108117 [Dreissena polymorpha]